MVVPEALDAGAEEAAGAVPAGAAGRAHGRQADSRPGPPRRIPSGGRYRTRAAAPSGRSRGRCRRTGPARGACVSRCPASYRGVAVALGNGQLVGTLVHLDAGVAAHALEADVVTGCLLGQALPQV